jgi:hypothetical protein
VASVDLRTSNGSISVDYPLTTQLGDANTRTAVQGTIGDGGTQVIVPTSNGRIAITRQGA